MLDLVMTSRRYAIVAGLSLLLGLPPLAAHAGVIIDGSRQIYPEQRREITIRLTNDDLHAPRLVQAWLDKGNPNESPALSDVPFNLSPPMFRLDAGKSQAMRLSYTKEPLPTDVESLFWLNVLEVPTAVSEFDPSLEESERNHMQFAFRIRTKVFFRPERLHGSPELASAGLRWSLRPSEQGQVMAVHNPSAYHVTLNEVALVMGEHPGAKRVEVPQGMVVPGGTLLLPVPKGVAAIPRDARVDFTYINDFGAFSSLQRAVLQR